jgi:hypothetical protein
MSIRGEEETPTLTEIMEELIEDRLYDVNTMMPGTIKSVDKARGLVSVQPDFMRVYQGSDEPVPYPTIEGVPLWELRAGEAVIRLPVKVGGKCMIIFSQRALEKWKAQGGTTRPGATRLHHLSDAVCIPGLYPVKDAKPLPDDLSIEFGKATMKFKDSDSMTLQIVNGTLKMDKDGKFKLSNGSSNVLVLLKELMMVEEEVIDAMTKMTFPTALGPSGTVINPAPFIKAVQDIGKIRKKLTQMILE